MRLRNVRRRFPERNLRPVSEDRSAHLSAEILLLTVVRNLGRSRDSWWRQRGAKQIGQPKYGNRPPPQPAQQFFAKIALQRKSSDEAVED